MIIWIFRIVALVGTPIITYFQISRDTKGAFFGLCIGIALIGIEYMLENVNLLSLIIGVVGAAIGLIMAKLMDYTVFQIANESLNIVWDKYTIVIKFALALLGMIIAVKKLPELDDMDRNILSLGKKYGKNMKILEMSAIVDGRILDVCETKFITGSIITPRFIVQELHSLADSRDSISRAKGRRGLDILARLQESKDIPFKIIVQSILQTSQGRIIFTRVKNGKSNTR
jgi:uncharacterized protein YacL